MAEAALDYDYFEPDETLEIPDGGIADFLTAKTGSWADDEVPSSGIARVKHVVDQLAEYGRFDDEYMVHAAPNETVVPLPVLNANPRLKAALFTQMREMGLDPERYIVGNELNSINPITGQREFGFFKKIGKKIKKFFKKVVKVIKKIAPVVLPIALSFVPFLGPIYGSMLGSGIGTLLQGGDFKDALKSAALSGVTAGIFKGVQGGIQGARAGTSFGEGFRTSVGQALHPMAAQTAAQTAMQEQVVDQLVQPDVDAAMGAIPTGDVPMDVPFPPPTDVVPTGPTLQNVGTAVSPDISAVGAGTPTIGAQPFSAAGPTPASLYPSTTTPPPPAALYPSTTPPAALYPSTTPPGPGAGDGGVGDLFTGGTGQTGQQLGQVGGTDVRGTQAIDDSVDFLNMTAKEREAFTQAAIAEQQQPSFFDRLKPGEDFSLMEAFSPTGPTKESLWAKYFPESTALTGTQNEFIQEVLKARGVTPGLLRRYGPLLGASMLASRVAAGQEEEPESLFDTGITGIDLLTEEPEKYTFDMNMPATDFPIQQWEGTGTGRQPTIQWAQPTGAAGGDVDSYPPRIGGINGPGTGTSDDVPAMLSDGEFVFTAKAVRGAGNGSRKNGTSNLYSMMRNFEGRV